MMITSIDSTNYEIYDPIRFLWDDDAVSAVAFGLGEIGEGDNYEDATDDLTSNITSKFHELFINESRTDAEERQYGWMCLHIREIE